MPVKRFINKRPRIFLATLATVCVGASLAVTQVMATIHSPITSQQNNKHQIPENLHSEKSFYDQLIEPIELEAKELLDEVDHNASIDDSETIHAIALKDGHGESKPVYDFTTGTSN